MEYMRAAILSWSEFIKVSKFARLIGVSPQSVSNWLKYGASSLSDDKKKELYYSILNYMRDNFA